MCHFFLFPPELLEIGQKVCFGGGLPFGLKLLVHFVLDVVGIQRHVGTTQGLVVVNEAALVGPGVLFVDLQQPVLPDVELGNVWALSR